MKEDWVFDSPFPSETLIPEPEYDDYVPECPPDFDDEQDVAATEEFLNSLVFSAKEWRTLGVPDLTDVRVGLLLQR